MFGFFCRGLGFFPFEEGGEGASGYIRQKQDLLNTLHLELIVVVTLVICVSAESSHVKGETFKSPFAPSLVPSARFSQQNGREVSSPRLNVE